MATQAQKHILARNLPIELDNALYALKALGARQGAQILRKAIKDIKALYPQYWHKDDE